MIEHAHWQRTFRPRLEAFWDYVVGELLRVPVPGVRLDRMMVIAIPLDVAEQLDEDLFAFVADTRLDADWEEASPSETPAAAERRPFWVGSTIPREELPSDDDAPRVKVMDPSLPARPFRVHPEQPAQPVGRGDGRAGPLRAARRAPPDDPRRAVRARGHPDGPGPVGRPVGPAGDAAGKTDRDLHPAGPREGPRPRKVVAIWIYQDASMAVVYLDFQSKERYILWHAPDAHQFNYENVEELRIRLTTMNLEIPGRLDGILSKK